MSVWSIFGRCREINACLLKFLAGSIISQVGPPFFFWNSRGASMKIVSSTWVHCHNLPMGDHMCILGKFEVQEAYWGFDMIVIHSKHLKPIYMISLFWHLGGGTSLNCFAKVKVNAQLSQSIKKELQKYEARWAIHEMGASNRVECLERNTDASASHDVTWTKYTVTFKSGLSPKVRFQLCLSTISPSSSGHGKDPLLEGKWHFSDSGEESDPLYFSMF